LLKLTLSNLLNNKDIQQFLKFMFAHHPPLTPNRLTQAFKNKYPELKIKTVKEYMGVIFFEKKKGGYEKLNTA